MSNTPAERRPIASRERPFWQWSAGKLAAAGMSPNLISILGMVSGLVAGAALLTTACVSPFTARLLYLAAAATIQLRLVANMLDGMVAIASGKASPVGELYNEIPDRISDTAILVCAGYAAFSSPALGWAAAVFAMFVTYLRALGKTLHVSGLFIGPMSKSHRMATLTLACLYLALAPRSLQPLWTVPRFDRPLGLMSIALAVIVLGALITAVRRLARIVRTLKAAKQQD